MLKYISTRVSLSGYRSRRGGGGTVTKREMKNLSLEMVSIYDLDEKEALMIKLVQVSGYGKLYIINV